MGHNRQSPVLLARHAFVPRLDEDTNDFVHLFGGRAAMERTPHATWSGGDGLGNREGVMGYVG
jgi:hypothetical protein